ncbi:hypothetical protein BSQ39_09555 [Loigolactobacillus backii]|uniref:phage terminase small subunit P27 family n=1 Tax=Loigolactobacillus backii TaxID=375175 RepID=UPI000C1CB26F|nr:phage terminase small subunit P27 family [Loigolactobacillus backii]PIO83794.1 hypothetical protein BSQ39_09555 [Loigolactobacillus backii]
MTAKQLKPVAEITANITKEQRATRKDAEKALFKYPKLETNPPKYLSATATKEWDRIVPLLKRDIPISELDYQLIANYCQLVGVITTCQQDIKKHGLVVTNAQGNKHTNPYTTLQLNAMRELRSEANELGLTVSARQHFELNKAKDKPKKDKFEEMLA